jgi:ABC-type dipeptide/oligopeptide/nickel transport system permease subunit
VAHPIPMTVWGLLFLLYLGGSFAIAALALPTWGGPPSKHKVEDMPPTVQVIIAAILIFAWPIVACLIAAEKLRDKKP